MKSRLSARYASQHYASQPAATTSIRVVFRQSSGSRLCGYFQPDTPVKVGSKCSIVFTASMLFFV